MARRSRSAPTASCTSRSVTTGCPPTRSRLPSYHGKILRINPDGTVPSDNPFVDGAGGNKDEIWAYGLRNPYRVSFDSRPGRLYVGDVGGNDDATAWEELNVGRARRQLRLAALRRARAATAGITSPIYSYPHNGRDAAIMGGFVYHGSQFPAATRATTSSRTTPRTGSSGSRSTPPAHVTGVFNFEPLDGASTARDRRPRLAA